MKEITFRVPDELAHLLEEWARLIPEMELVYTEDCDLSEDMCSRCVRRAILQLKTEGVIRRVSDYAWIMTALEQGIISELKGFRSPQAFIDYLRQLGIEHLPCRTTLFMAYNNMVGQYPNWTFTDTTNPNEILRRKNVVVRFKSAFLRAKREFMNESPNKRP